MSTERQDYSLVYQAAAIRAYADAAGYQIVRSFTDEGVSGLGIKGRSGLKKLLADIVSGAADFSVVLVYDVSRWGRFQNPDQAAHYEFICAEAGVMIEYCAEGFANDASPISALIKHIKRTMAAEYSRELSVKVHRAQTGLKRAGYWMGSTPGFGLRREAVALDGRSLGLLTDGQYNSYPLAHTRLALGPEHEIDAVRSVFSLYLKRGSTMAGVAEQLNSKGVPGLRGKPWTMARVRKTLTDARYAGDLVVHQRRTTLGVTRLLPTSEWEYVSQAVPPIVDRSIFDAVQKRLAQRRKRVTRAEALEDVLSLLRAHGRISHHVLRRFGKWTSRLYTARLGSVDNMYALCGQTRPYSHNHINLKKAAAARRKAGQCYTEEQLLISLRSLLSREGCLTARLIEQSADTPSPRTYQLRFGSLARAYEQIGYAPVNRRQEAQVSRILALK